MSQRKHLIVGQAPQRNTEPHRTGPIWRPWESASGKRLAKMMGMSLEEMLDLFDTTNLNAALRGTNGKYDKFDMKEAGIRAQLLLEEIDRYELVLCCGKQVASLMGAPALNWKRIDVNTWVGGVPHPGGTNMW